MRFVNRIVFKSPPPENIEDNELYVEDGKLQFKPIGQQPQPLALKSDFSESMYKYTATDFSDTHVVNHNLNSKQLIISIQVDNNGEPGEYIQTAEVKPSSIDPLNSIIITSNIPIKIHVLLLKQIVNL